MKNKKSNLKAKHVKPFTPKQHINYAVNLLQSSKRGIEKTIKKLSEDLKSKDENTRIVAKRRLNRQKVMLKEVTFALKSLCVVVLASFTFFAGAQNLKRSSDATKAFNEEDLYNGGYTQRFDEDFYQYQNLNFPDLQKFSTETPLTTAPPPAPDEPDSVPIDTALPVLVLAGLILASRLRTK